MQGNCKQVSAGSLCKATWLWTVHTVSCQPALKFICAAFGLSIEELGVARALHNISWCWSRWWHCSAQASPCAWCQSLHDKTDKRWHSGNRVLFASSFHSPVHPMSVTPGGQVGCGTTNKTSAVEAAAADLVCCGSPVQLSCRLSAITKALPWEREAETLTHPVRHAAVDLGLQVDNKLLAWLSHKPALPIVLYERQRLPTRGVKPH